MISEKIIKNDFLNQVFDKFENHKEIAVICYGSFNGNNKDDFDTCIILNDYDFDDIKKITNIVVGIHEKYKLRIDNEIPYENKLIFTFDELNKLSEFPPAFHRRSCKFLDFPDDELFLKSEDSRNRLLFNILCSKIDVLYGNIDQLRQKAFKKMIECIFVHERKKH